MPDDHYAELPEEQVEALRERYKDLIDFVVDTYGEKRPLSDPSHVVGMDTIERLRLAGFAVVPFDVPAHAVGEVMTWTRCKDANMAAEALNDALNLLSWPHDIDPDAIRLLERLGSGDITLEEYWPLDKERIRLRSCN